MMRMVMLTLVACGLVLAADEMKDPARTANTQHLDLPSGGTVRIAKSSGEMSIEGWDQPGVQISAVKTTWAEGPAAAGAKGPDETKLAAESKGGEVVITGGAASPYVEYRIQVPRDAKIVVERHKGDLHFDGLTGDIRATGAYGSMTVRLPEDSAYTVDAKSKVGNVISDFPGGMKHPMLGLGHAFTQTSSATHKLNLKEGFGDILILKMWKPTAPAGRK